MSFNPLMQVDLFGVECNTNVPDANGAVWFVRDVQGWDSPTQRMATMEPTGRPGIVIAASLHGGRELTVEGSVHADSASDVRAAYTTLCGLMPGVGYVGDVVVYEDGDPKAVTVEQLDKPVVRLLDGNVYFTLTLIAPDPYKRAVDPVTVSIAAGATVSLDNDGTAPAFLTVEATGSGTVQVRQNDSGQVLRSKASVSSGTTFNGTTKRVTSSGGAVLLGVVGNPSEWLSIPRLATTPVTNQGTAPVDVTYYHAYA